MVCGLPGEELVTGIESVPAAVAVLGRKVTVMVQLPGVAGEIERHGEAAVACGADLCLGEDLVGGGGRS